MSPAQPLMIAEVVEIEQLRLRNGKRVVLVGLDRSHAEVMRFEAPLQTNRPASARKRRKARLPEDSFSCLQTWLVPPGGTPRQVKGAFGFVDPITAPARFSFTIDTAVNIPIGSKLELRVVISGRAAAGT